MVGLPCPVCGKDVYMFSTTVYKITGIKTKTTMPIPSGFLSCSPCIINAAKPVPAPTSTADVGPTRLENGIMIVMLNTTLNKNPSFDILWTFKDRRKYVTVDSIDDRDNTVAKFTVV